MSQESPTAPRRFDPPHCPNPDCRFFADPVHWSWKRIGSFCRPSSGERVPRGRCLSCGRTFSAATFEAAYWLRYRHLLPVIAAESVSGSSLRQIAALLGVHHTTVSRQVRRAGRLALLWHESRLRDHRIEEPTIADGFETFEYSQFFPCHYNLAVGQSSWFVYRFTDSPLRRKGRMTVRQKEIREQLEQRLGRPAPRAIETAMAELVTELLDHCRGELELHTDEHPAYPRAIRQVLGQRPGRTITHRRTSSKLSRTPRNPLFAVNLADLLIRHHGANHKRETIAFDKRRASGLLRLAVWMVWRNFVKPRREKRPGTTAAMVLGLAARPLRWAEVLSRRMFPGRVGLRGSWERYYREAVHTAALGERQREHCLRYAF